MSGGFDRVARLLVCLAIAGCHGGGAGDQREDGGAERDASAEPAVVDAGASFDAGAPDAGEVAPPASGETQLRVVQLNPYYAGRLAYKHIYSGSCEVLDDCAAPERTVCASTASADGCWECIDKKCRQRTWQTLTHAAGLIDAVGADVVGMQEIRPAFAERADAILEAATGTAWAHRVTTQGIDGVGSGIGVFWRESTVELVADLGHVDLDTLPSGYILRFKGVVLRPRGSDRLVGVFSGKLWWESGQAERRRMQAERLRDWMDDVMAPWEAMGAHARVLATDLNDTLGSPAYDVLVPLYDDGGAIKATTPGEGPDRRIDYLFWRDEPAGSGAGGFVTSQSDGHLGRSEYFGSDHRFVYGDARIP